MSDSRNPFDIFFGRSAVALLRSRPGALVRIVDTMKPLLMGVVHPDQNPNADPSVAAEISEAHLMLKNSDKEVLLLLIEKFLAQNKDQETKRKMRELTNSRDSLRTKVRELQDALAAERRESQKDLQRLERAHQIDAGFNLQAEQVLWNWVSSSMESNASSIGLSRSRLHQYRVVIKYGNKFRGLEFDLSGRVQRIITAVYLEKAKHAFLIRSQRPTPDVQIVTKRSKLLVGAAKNPVSDVENDILEGNISPFIKIGQQLVFIEDFKSHRGSRTALSIETSEPVVAIIPIRTTRKALFHRDKRSKKTKRQWEMSGKIREEKKRRKSRKNPSIESDDGDQNPNLGDK